MNNHAIQIRSHHHIRSTQKSAPYLVVGPGGQATIVDDELPPDQVQSDAAPSQSSASVQSTSYSTDSTIPTQSTSLSNSVSVSQTISSLSFTSSMSITSASSTPGPSSTTSSTQPMYPSSSQSSSSTLTPSHIASANKVSATHDPPFYVAIVLGSFAGIAIIAAVISYWIRLRVHTRQRREFETSALPWTHPQGSGDSLGQDERWHADGPSADTRDADSITSWGERPVLNPDLDTYGRLKYHLPASVAQRNTADPFTSSIVIPNITDENSVRHSLANPNVYPMTQGPYPPMRPAPVHQMSGVSVESRARMLGPLHMTNALSGDIYLSGEETSRPNTALSMTRDPSIYYKSPRQRTPVLKQRSSRFEGEGAPTTWAPSHNRSASLRSRRESIGPEDDETVIVTPRRKSLRQGRWAHEYLEPELYTLDESNEGQVVVHNEGPYIDGVDQESQLSGSTLQPAEDISDQMLSDDVQVLKPWAFPPQGTDLIPLQETSSYPAQEMNHLLPEELDHFALQEMNSIPPDFPPQQMLYDEPLPVAMSHASSVYSAASAASSAYSHGYASGGKTTSHRSSGRKSNKNKKRVGSRQRKHTRPKFVERTSSSSSSGVSFQSDMTRHSLTAKEEAVKRALKERRRRMRSMYDG